ncbi:MAG: polysaccharide biosynthesis C-terminal domain-containing protein [Chlorobiales bacterium]|nr:polysaccharide biosynthesis C-terminal domain-containing protein [Chlorobiales bacterium]
MSRNDVIAGQAGFSFAGFLFGQASRFGFNLLVARVLDADALGTYALAVAVIQISEVLAIAGLDSGLLRFVSVHSSDPLRQKAVIASALKTSLFLSIVVALFLVLFSGRIALMLHGSHLLQLTLCCYAAALPFNVATMLYGHAIQGFRKLQPKIIATQVLNPFFLLLLTLLFRSVVGQDAALFFPFALSGAVAFFWIRPFLSKISGVVPMDIVRASSDKAMMVYALPFMVVSLLSMITHWLDIMMLGMLTDTATVGLYHPAARTAGLIRAVLLAFAGIAAPMIAMLHAGSQSAEIGRIYKMVTRWIFGLVIPPVILFMLLPEMVLGVFGGRFIAGTSALLLLTAASFLQVCFGLSSTVLAMTGYARLSLYNAFGALGLQFVLNLFLIPWMGINGAALATLLVFFLLSAVRLAEVFILLKIHPFGKALWKPFVAGLCSALLLMGLRPWMIGLPVFAGFMTGALVVICCYTLFMLLLKLEQEEREIILRFVPFINKEPRL